MELSDGARLRVPAALDVIGLEQACRVRFVLIFLIAQL